MAWMIALDSLVILALAGGIFYAWRLERMLRGLDKNRQEMERFIGVFSSTITRAEKGIRDLQDTANDAGVDVDRQIARATALRDELSYLVDAADKIASRLTDTSSEAISRAPTPRMAVEEEAPPAPHPAPAPAPEPVYAAPQEKGGVPPWAKRATEKHVVINRGERTVNPAPEKAPEKLAAKSVLRSEAERDLQQALDKMRS